MVPECVFYYKNYQATPSIKAAVKKHQKKRRDDDSDNFTTNLPTKTENNNFNN